MKKIKLSEDIKYWRAERPDEWTMDEFVRAAQKLERELAELATEKHRLLIALHEAINRPKGIVPHEAEEFYDQDFYSTNSAQ